MPPISVTGSQVAFGSQTARTFFAAPNGAAGAPSFRGILASDLPTAITDSLWSLGSRSRSSVHKGDYHGNFVPQIPEQVLRRFTKADDVVLDMFCGMATTLIECRRLGRHGLGVELQPSICQQAQERLDAAENPNSVETSILCGDSHEAAIVTLAVWSQRVASQKNQPRRRPGLLLDGLAPATVIGFPLLASTPSSCIFSIHDKVST